MANVRRPVREFRGGSDAVAQFMAEVAGRLREGRTVRQQAIICLRFFGPLTESLRTPAALQELWREFGDALPAGSWLAKHMGADE